MWIIAAQIMKYNWNIFRNNIFFITIIICSSPIFTSNMTMIPDLIIINIFFTNMAYFCIFIIFLVLFSNFFIIFILINNFRNILCSLIIQSKNFSAQFFPVYNSIGLVYWSSQQTTLWANLQGVMLISLSVRFIIIITSWINWPC